MKVLHVIPSVGPLRGGPSVAMGLIARALRDAGVSVDVATSNDNERELLQVPIGVPVDEAGVRYWYFERSSYPYTTSAGLARWLRRQIRSYDLVHAHALFSFSTSIAGGAARRSRIPYIIRPLGTLAPYGMKQHTLLKQLSWLMLERRLLANAAAVHFTSEAERIQAERLGAWRSVVVPLGMELPDLPSEHARNDGPPTFLFLSRIHPKKRVDLLLRGFAEARRTAPAIALIIGGTGEAAYITQLKQLARELDIEQSVEWRGYLGGAEKRRALLQADAFILPSINENFGVAAVEAMAANLPVVLTRGVAIHREVEAAGAGLIIEDTQASLAGALLALRSPIDRQRMGTNARTLARTTFSISAMQDGLVKLYEKTLQA